MKLGTLAVAAVLSMPMAAFAQNLQCGKVFGMQVAECQKIADNRALPPFLRAEAHKACIAGAREAKQACILGIDPCVAQCEAAFVAESQFCNTQFDPAQCAGRPDQAICEIVFTEARRQCLLEAEAERAVCLAACPAP